MTLLGGTSKVKAQFLQVHDDLDTRRGGSGADAAMHTLPKVDGTAACNSLWTGEMAMDLHSSSSCLMPALGTS